MTVFPSSLFEILVVWNSGFGIRNGTCLFLFNFKSNFAHYFAKFNFSYNYFTQKKLNSQIYREFLCQFTRATNVQIAPEYSRAAGALLSIVTQHIERSHLHLMTGKKMRLRIHTLIVLTHFWMVSIVDFPSSKQQITHNEYSHSLWWKWQ